MALTKEKILYSTELLKNGNLQSLYKIRIYENGELVSETNHREVVDNKDITRIKDVCGEIVAKQLQEIAEKHSEIESLKEEKAVLLSEKLALIDEVELHKAENVEIKLNLKE